jgi:hypothetical protein
MPRTSQWTGCLEQDYMYALNKHRDDDVSEIRCM